MDRGSKENFLGDFTTVIKSKGLVFTEYHGLTVREFNELRNTLTAFNASYQVVKNTIASIALKSLNIEGLQENLKGPTAIAIIDSDDPLGAVKKLIQFSKTHEKLKIKEGYLFGKRLKTSEIKGLADIPSKEVLLTKTVMSLNALLVNLVRVLSAPLGEIVFVLDRIQKKTGGEKNEHQNRG
ncbi:MAG: 50S ribosomal protein L10 [Elusimicrobia bacterium]|nr:50S ribosomal protein L10 [Elusimicrobiota bacterium]